MKIWIPNIGNWIKKIEPYARYFMWWFGIILATATVASISNILSQTNKIIIWICLFLFIIAGLIVWISDVRRFKQKGIEIPRNIELSGYNRWISIGAVVLVVLVIFLTFLARQLPATTQGYQAFFTGFAGIGAWITGIALVIFSYQQYKLRQTEHSLMFEPKLFLSSGGSPMTGQLNHNNLIYPYRVEWSVIIINTSQQPILIEFMALKIRLWVENPNKPNNDEFLSISSYHVLEPDRIALPFQVTQSNPQRIRWILEGHDVSYDLDHISGNTNNRRFELIFKIRATIPQYPDRPPIIMELVSNPFHVPKDAAWGIPKSILY